MPSDKRARQRAGRQARQAELAAAQKRSRRNRQGIVVGVILLAAVGLVVYAGSRGSSKSPSSKVVAGSPSTTTTGPTTTIAAGAPSSATPAALAALKARTPPPLSASCSASPTPSAATTTVPAKAPAVAVVDAPAGIGFPKADGSSPHYTHFSAAPPFCIDVTKTYTAEMVTDVGTITISLYPKDAPVTVNSFVFLAGYHYFDGIVFHRVIPGFVDQGGDPTGTGSGGPGYSFADELPASAAAYDNGSLAMANSGANTNGSQFFLVVNGGGAQLQPLYSDFGQITGGLSVANRINADGNTSGTPTVVHRIVSVSVTSN